MVIIMDLIDKLHNSAVSEKEKEITELINILLKKILKIAKKPNIAFVSIMLSHLDTINNTIYINNDESIYKNKSIFNISNECFHVFQSEAGQCLQYDDIGRKIIEGPCPEYRYNYDFEVDSSAFALAFTNYYISYILEYNYTYPFEISSSAKTKYPSLEEKEIEIKYRADKYYNNYIEKFKEHTVEIKNIKI